MASAAVFKTASEVKSVMAGVAQPTPLALLLDIEHRARKHTGGPTLREQVLDEWVGIEFRLGTLRLAAPLEEVLEILKFPELTKVPRTKPWVRGIANVRGNLLPVMDLQGFLAGRLTAINRDSRVLVISHKVIFAGLLVDQVMGIKRFPKESQIQALPPPEASLVPYLRNAFSLGMEEWRVFSVCSVAEALPFMEVAA